MPRPGEGGSAPVAAALHRHRTGRHWALSILGYAVTAGATRAVALAAFAALLGARRAT